MGIQWANMIWALFGALLALQGCAYTNISYTDPCSSSSSCSCPAAKETK